MSHFTVVVRVPEEMVSALGVEAALAKMMAPYQENNMGDCQEEFLAFIDKEAEYSEEYATGTSTMVRLGDGTLAEPTDDRFRVPGTFGIGTSTHRTPEHLAEVEVPHKERYKTFEEFASKWHGSKRDPKTNRHGYWENPNARWDWYAIGGRWTGFFPLRDPRTATLGERGAFGNPPRPWYGDVCRLSEIDTDAMAREARDGFEKWWLAFEAYRRDPAAKQDPFDGPRAKAYDLGLVVVRRGPPEPGEESRAHRWGDIHRNITDERRDWHDVISDITKADAERLVPAFSPSAPYATLDVNGWHADGEMGWFGCSSEEPGGRLEHKASYPEWLTTTPPGDVLVAVDCHI